MSHTMMPATKASAFSPTESLKDFDEGASSERTVVLNPTQAFAGQSSGGTVLPNKLVFQYNSPAGRAFVDLSKSMIRIRMQFASDAAFTTQLDSDTAEQNNGVARFGAANMFEKATLRIANREIENCTDHPQATSLLYQATKTRSWLETAGSLIWAQPVDSDRDVTDAVSGSATGPVVYDVWFRPAISLFHESKLIRSGGAIFEIALDRRADWGQGMMVNLESPKVATTEGSDFFVKVLSAEWHIDELYPEEDVPVQSDDVVDASQLRIVRANLDAASTITREVVIQPAAFKFLAGYQDANQASDGTNQLADFIPKDANTFRVEWSGQQLPSTPYDLNFTNGPVSRAYMDFLKATGQLNGPMAGAGASVDADDWKSTSTIYGFPLVARRGAKSTNLRVRATFNSAAGAGDQLIMGVASPLRVFLSYDESGRMTSVDVAESESDVVSIIE
jgi:hypothetical protein